MLEEHKTVYGTKLITNRINQWRSQYPDNDHVRDDGHDRRSNTDRDNRRGLIRGWFYSTDSVQADVWRFGDLYYHWWRAIVSDTFHLF
jgi:hypothetical protein